MGVDLTELAISVVILGIIVSVGAVILTNIRNTQITNVGTYKVANESITLNDGAGSQLTKTWVSGVDAVTTNSTTVLAGNYTLSVSPDTGVGIIKSTGAGLYNGTNVNATYNVYNISDPRYTLPNQAATGIGEYGNWFKIIVIVGVAAVILGLIFMAFNRAGGGSSMGGSGSSEGAVNY